MPTSLCRTTSRSASITTSRSRWAVMSDLQWTHWSLLKEITIAPLNGAPTTNLPLNWRSTWFVGVGTSYRVLDTLLLQTGFSYDQSPVPDFYRTTRVPDSDRYNLGVGVTWSVLPNVNLQAAYLHTFFANAPISNSAYSLRRHDPGQVRRQRRFGQPRGDPEVLRPVMVLAATTRTPAPEIRARSLVEMFDSRGRALRGPARDQLPRAALELSPTRRRRRARGAGIAGSRGREGRARRALPAEHALFGHPVLRDAPGRRHRGQLQPALRRARTAAPDRRLRHDDHGRAGSRA